MPGTYTSSNSWFIYKKSLKEHSNNNNKIKALHNKFGYHSKNILNGELCFGTTFGNIEPAIQTDMIDLNTHYNTNDDRLTFGLGLIYSPVANYLIKLKYDIVQERSEDQIDNNCFWAAIVVEF